ncbi:hypothetical protein Tco_0682431 [Tanacetum coccineum]|uniref:Uncharacterized protein n=1 Tax=Tanacetum coccineum TaxID=301880 RepID=A0ABQ4XS42_9ASTR
MASLAPQDRWSKDKHIELVNIIGNPGAGMLTRAMAKELSAASAHECLFVDFLSEKEPKRSLKHLSILDGLMQCIINKEKYVKDLLKKYDINDSLVKTPMVPPNNLTPDLNGKSLNETHYKGDIKLHFIPTQYQLTDIFTKPLDEPTFKRLIVELGEVGVTTFKNSIGENYLSHLTEYAEVPSLEIVKAWFSTTGYSEEIGEKGTLKRVEDIINKLNKKTREEVVPYPKFVSLLLKYKIEGYGNDNVTFNLTQVFSVHNCALNKNQAEGPPFTPYMLAICNVDELVAFKAPKISLKAKKKDTQGIKPEAKSG